MISSKLKMLERQLSAVGGRDTGDSGSSTKALLAFQSVVEEEANALIKAAEDKCREAEAKVDGLQKQINELNKQLVQLQKDASSKMEEMYTCYKQDMEVLCKKYDNKIYELQESNASLSQDLAECQGARIRAETEKEAAEKMCKHLEGMVTKLQEVKPMTITTPITPPVVTAARPVTAKVTQRDENGRIVAISITPSS